MNASTNHLLSRSWLFTPATRPERFPKAITVGADIQIVDLEDSVSPADKDRARDTALRFLQSPPHGVTYALRLNSIDSSVGLADWVAFLGSDVLPTYLVIPKVDSVGHLQIMERLLDAARKPVRLVAQLESARGLAQAEAIATTPGRLAGLMFGTADMAADLGTDHSWPALHYARSRLVASAALRGLLAVDAPYFDIHDLDGLRAEATLAVASGFSGKCAIHPSHVAIVNEAWVPSDSEVEHARAVLAENEKGVGVAGGIMVDEAVARRARRILSRAPASVLPVVD